MCVEIRIAGIDGIVEKIVGSLAQLQHRGYEGCMTLRALDPSPVELTSEVVRVGEAPRAMSQRWWGLDWSTILPWTIGDVSVEHGSFDEVVPFLEANYARLFGEPNQHFLIEEMTEAKRRFWAEADVFIFRRAGEMIGYWGGHPSDWSTYYCRTMSILPEFRESRLATELSNRICQTLARTSGADGSTVQRIEVDASIANIPMTRMLLGLGFIVTSTSVSERWGTLLRFTKLLREDAARVFRQQFVYVPEFGRDTRNPNRRGP
jgi:hypothetical protein